MTSSRHILIALYDATKEESLYGDSSGVENARTLGVQLARAGYGVVTRAGCPLSGATASSVASEGYTAILLSPAGSAQEHSTAFRLPQTQVTILYTGKGALGADVIALESSQAILIIGSSSEELDGILGCIGSRLVPIGILANDTIATVRSRVLERYPELVHHIFVETDPVALAQSLGNEIRKRNILNHY